jgi:hypothetical protein
MSWNDESVLPGPTGTGAAIFQAGLQVYQLASGVALAEVCYPTLDKVANPNDQTPFLWLDMACDDGAGNAVGFYIIVGSPGHAFAVNVPDPLANVSPGLNLNQQCIFVPPGIEYHRKWYPNQWFRAIQYSGANAYLRVEATSMR